METLLKAISEKNIPLLWGIILCSLIAFFWNCNQYRQKRYISRILMLVFIFGVTISLYLSDALPLPAGVTIILLWGVHARVSYLTTVKSKVIFPETRSIACLKAMVRSGEYSKIEERFPKKPFWIMSTPGRKAWDLLWAEKLIGQDQIKEAYEIHSNILMLPLLEQEVNEIRLNQATNLLMLGDTIGAKSVFERVPINQNQKREILFLQSLFDERTGDFEKARKNLLLATREYENKKSICLANIYNNLGRMEKVLNNTTNTLHYYQKSADLAKHLNIKKLIHISYPNLIDTYLLINDIKNAKHFLNEYSEIIDLKNTDDLLFFNNYNLEYARQTKDRTLFMELLKTGRIELLPKITPQEKLCFEISELRIRWNNACEWDKKLFFIEHDLQKYFDMDFPYNYNTTKEIFNILIELVKTNRIGPFIEMFSKILEFMGNSKEKIRNHIIHLPDYCVEERCYWEKQSTYLRKIQKNNDPETDLYELLNAIFGHLRNIKDIQLQHGNYLLAIEADLDIADECMGVITQLTIQNVSIDPYYLHVMGLHIKNAYTGLEKFTSHPVSFEYALRIARYALFLRNQKIAKKYFEYFLQSKISIFHYANWIQRYYYVLAHFFNHPVK